MSYATRNRKYAIDVLAIVFGTGSWVAVNGIWVELPILVEKLPEGWNLPSYMTIICQIGNVGAIAYGLLHGRWPRIVNETSATILMMIIGVLACYLLTFLWDWTLAFGGASHSVSFFALVFFVSLVDCTSSVVFLPFMGTFRDIYLPSYFIGEGLSGFLPSVVGLAQGVGGNAQCVNVSSADAGSNATWSIEEVTPQPTFSVTVFFFFLCAMMVASFAAFLILRFVSIAPSERVSPQDVADAGQAYSSSSAICDSASGSSAASQEAVDIHGSSDYLSRYGAVFREKRSSYVAKRLYCYDLDRPWHWTYFYLLFIQTWVSFFQNGVLLSVQSYSCLPYGNVAYHLTVTLSNIAAPLAFFAAFFVPVHNTLILTVETIISTLIGSYILVLAVLSPDPPLRDATPGVVLVVLAWILFSGLVSHTKASLGTIFWMKGRWALFWCGAVTQVGSAVGAIIMFLLVNVYSLFHSYDPCFS